MKTTQTGAVGCDDLACSRLQGWLGWTPGNFMKLIKCLKRIESNCTRGYQVALVLTKFKILRVCS